MIGRALSPLLFALYGALSCCAAYGTPPSVAIVYLEVRDPYRSIFLEIARGMEQELGKLINSRSLI